MKRRKTPRIYVMQWDTGDFECFEERFNNEWIAKYMDYWDSLKKVLYFDDSGVYHNFK